MSWLLITIVAYALNSIALLMDKFLLSKKLPNPAAYTLAICLLGLLGIVLLPFGWQAPTIWQAAIALLAGALFSPGLYLMFVALKNGESSRIIPFLGGLQPLIIFPLTWFFLGERFGPNLIIAFILLILGTILISIERGKASTKAYIAAIGSAVLFAVSLAMSKWAYQDMNSFITPFVLTRIGSAVAVLPLLLIPGIFTALKSNSKTAKSGNTFILLMIGQTCGALSSVLINFAVAISKNATAIINALQGLQYVFLLIGAIILTKYFPKLFKEKFNKKILIQKITAIGLIIAGLALLAI